MDDYFDIYDDLPNFSLEAEIEKLQSESNTLHEKTVFLLAQINKLNDERDRLLKQNDILHRNVSQLLTTAKKELIRKDAIISQLRQELEALKKNVSACVSGFSKGEEDLPEKSFNKSNPETRSHLKPELGASKGNDCPKTQRTLDGDYFQGSDRSEPGFHIDDEMRIHSRDRGDDRSYGDYSDLKRKRAFYGKEHRSRYDRRCDNMRGGFSNERFFNRSDRGYYRGKGPYRRDDPWNDAVGPSRRHTYDSQFPPKKSRTRSRSRSRSRSPGWVSSYAKEYFPNREDDEFTSKDVRDSFVHQIKENSLRSSMRSLKHADVRHHSLGRDEHLVESNEDNPPIVDINPDVTEKVKNCIKDLHSSREEGELADELSAHDKGEDYNQVSENDGMYFKRKRQRQKPPNTLFSQRMARKFEAENRKSEEEKQISKEGMNDAIKNDNTVSEHLALLNKEIFKKMPSALLSEKSKSPSQNYKTDERSIIGSQAVVGPKVINGVCGESSETLESSTVTSKAIDYSPFKKNYHLEKISPLPSKTGTVNLLEYHSKKEGTVTNEPKSEVSDVIIQKPSKPLTPTDILDFIVDSEEKCKSVSFEKSAEASKELSTAHDKSKESKCFDNVEVKKSEDCSQKNKPQEVEKEAPVLNLDNYRIPKVRKTTLRSSSATRKESTDRKFVQSTLREMIKEAEKSRSSTSSRSSSGGNVRKLSLLKSNDQCKKISSRKQISSTKNSSKKSDEEFKEKDKMAKTSFSKKEVNLTVLPKGKIEESDKKADKLLNRRNLSRNRKNPIDLSPLNVDKKMDKKPDSFETLSKEKGVTRKKCVINDNSEVPSSSLRDVEKRAVEERKEDDDDIWPKTIQKSTDSPDITKEPTQRPDILTETLESFKEIALLRTEVTTTTSELSSQPESVIPTKTDSSKNKYSLIYTSSSSSSSPLSSSPSSQGRSLNAPTLTASTNIDAKPVETVNETVNVNENGQLKSDLHLSDSESEIEGSTSPGGSDSDASDIIMAFF